MASSPPGVNLPTGCMAEEVGVLVNDKEKVKDLNIHQRAATKKECEWVSLKKSQPVFWFDSVHPQSCRIL
ncbi:hypothetical protein Pmani_000267 [Petrolisthes manimaculis]|uniref:Uncharacterized protein n=1 Tax=Petrolisthes manimaculis TaxID=1843537 RepID=A0AAE1QMF3_9EUCA|nr:hypothetical protein Pmani_000267 [Petrolisthes manimaculis]